MVRRRCFCVILAATALVGGCSGGADGEEQPSGTVVPSTTRAEADGGAQPVEPHVRPVLTRSGVMLFPLAEAAARECHSIQQLTPVTVLCPALLPRATIGWPQRARLPALRTERFQLGKTLIGIEFAYGVPVEPREGIPREWVKRNLWRNRPCCAFHFTIEWDFEGKLGRIPSAARRASLGGKTGRLLQATGYAFRTGDGSRGPFWANHTWFFWSERGATYAASVHFFGHPGTERLLGELVARLRPADRL